MAFRPGRGLPDLMGRRAAQRQLVAQVLPFEFELAARHRDAADRRRRAELAAVEAVAARQRFGMHRRQVRVDRGQRLGVFTEALQLRVVLVAARLAAQHRTRQQGLAPERDQALRIEVPGVEGPEAHGRARQSGRGAAGARGGRSISGAVRRGPRRVGRGFVTRGLPEGPLPRHRRQPGCQFRHAFGAGDARVGWMGEGAWDGVWKMAALAFGGALSRCLDLVMGANLHHFSDAGEGMRPRTRLSDARCRWVRFDLLVRRVR